MNKKGGSGVGIFFGIMIAVMVWIAFSQLLGPMVTATSDARAVDQLDCDNSSISTGEKATCVIVDYTVFGFTAAIISVIIGLAGGGLIGVLTKKKE